MYVNDSFSFGLTRILTVIRHSYRVPTLTYDYKRLHGYSFNFCLRFFFFLFKPLFWFRYVDDPFILWPPSKWRKEMSGTHLYSQWRRKKVFSNALLIHTSIALLKSIALVYIKMHSEFYPNLGSYYCSSIKKD